MSVLRIISWNVNGIRAAHKKGFLDWLNTESPDIMCVQETKASEDQLPGALKEIPGYHSYFVSAEKKGYSGVAVFTKTKPEAVTSTFLVESFSKEGRVLSVDFGQFVLLNVYFPNGKSSAERLKYKMEFYHDFLEYVDGIKESGKNVVICGDVNTAHKEIDLARPKANEATSGFLPEERAWIDKLLDHGYLDTLRMFSQEPDQYTYWDMITRARDRNVGWRIDYFFVNEAFSPRLKTSFILADVMGSDHCPIGIEID
ncbi:MAG: exodeoxyribonuclease III [SAR202 cluster bacterium Io17-Chloro-G7]|nr:MAG: exodeoxyribonuclease III [SAR202 cluster bacterium Io17-Chloro-G7]